MEHEGDRVIPIVIGTLETIPKGLEKTGKIFN